MFKQLRAEIDSFSARDPAARSRWEVVLCYPGLHAVCCYRLTHALWRGGWRLPARCLAHLGRWLTGVEIHPGAMLGKRLFIDHGAGVVIGETARVGDDVTMYHGVTLGGTAIGHGEIRHPQVGDGVILGAGAQVLGPVTVGEGARIGANAVVVHDVEPHTTMVGVPARPVRLRDGEVLKDEGDGDFAAYGITPGEWSDPVMRHIRELRKEVEALKEKVGDKHGLPRLRGSRRDKEP